MGGFLIIEVFSVCAKEQRRALVNYDWRRLVTPIISKIQKMLHELIYNLVELEKLLTYLSPSGAQTCFLLNQVNTLTCAKFFPYFTFRSFLKFLLNGLLQSMLAPT